jgi:hypothetical protein
MHHIAWLGRAHGGAVRGSPDVPCCCGELGVEEEKLRVFAETENFGFVAGTKWGAVWSVGPLPRTGTLGSMAWKRCSFNSSRSTKEKKKKKKKKGEQKATI